MCSISRCIHTTEHIYIYIYIYIYIHVHNTRVYLYTHTQSCLRLSWRETSKANGLSRLNKAFGVNVHSNPNGCERKNRSAPNLCRKLKCKQLYKHFLICLTYALYAAQAYVACVCVCVWCMFKICVCKCLCICYVLCIMYTHVYE